MRSSTSSSYSPITTFMSSSTSTTSNDINQDVLSWKDLHKMACDETVVGKALMDDLKLRQSGYGPAHVDNLVRLFDKPSTFKPKFTLYRDKAGWCPYCEKTMLLVEEKRIPINIRTVNMRSYGDKPQEFLRLVPNGLLPVLIVHDDDGRDRIITESQVIMEYLDEMHPVSDGYKQMVPSDSDKQQQQEYRYLTQLERQLFGAWCQLMFRPENIMQGGNLMSGLMNAVGGGGSQMSGSMTQFLQVMEEVDRCLLELHPESPFFFGDVLGHDGPTMIDFIFISHVERMLASCAYWKGLDLRSEEYRSKYPGLNAWLDAFDLRSESYLGFKSDYYTNVMDIPPQYGYAYDGGFENLRNKYQSMIDGTDNTSWKLPLPHDDPLQPLYIGPPLPMCVLEAAGLQDYNNADSTLMSKTCRQMAGWKLSSNGEKVAAFAARGSSKGSKNPRKTFQAPLADPYAESDQNVLPQVDLVLREICQAMLNEEDEATLDLSFVVSNKNDVKTSLIYLRDRIGVPRDLPLAAARQLRAYLNVAIDSL